MNMAEDGQSRRSIEGEICKVLLHVDIDPQLGGWAKVLPSNDGEIHRCRRQRNQRDQQDRNANLLHRTHVLTTYLFVLEALNSFATTVIPSEKRP